MKRVLVISAMLAPWLACSTGTAPAENPERQEELGEPTGEVAPELISAAVRDNSRQFQLCLARERERNPALMGLVEVRFLINSDGSIGHAQVVDTDLPSSIADCVANAFYAVRMPQRESAVVAQFPMFFQPG